MQIVCIHNARIPTEKAHGYAIMKMCEEFARMGERVSLIVPRRVNSIGQDAFSYYGLIRNFTLEYIHCTDILRLRIRGPLAFWGQSLSFLWKLKEKNIPRSAVIVTRNPEIAWWYGRKGYAVFYDAHNFPERRKRTFLFLLRYSRGIIANSFGTKRAFEEAGFRNVIALHNAVDLEQFEKSKATNRRSYGVLDGRIAMYVGHLYTWKGVDVVIQAARESKINDLTFVFVGGTDEDLLRYRVETKDLKNVLFLGHRSRCDIPSILMSADVLLLPNIPNTRESEAYTSPIKMFEYMASGIPIVASDMPSIREVLNEKNAIMVEPGDPSALLVGIQKAMAVEGRECARRAKEEVMGYTWQIRAEKAVTFIRRICVGS